jgi:glycosyltransferase involved in cell wall biosynthesis
MVTQILHELPECTTAKITAISNRDIVIASRDPHIQWLEDKSWARVPGNVWLSARVPGLLKKIGATHFLGTQHLMPVRRVRNVHYGVLMLDVVHLKFPHSMHWSNRIASNLLFRRSYAIADSILAISESTRSDLCKYFWPRDIAVAYPGVTDASALEKSRAAVSGKPLMPREWPRRLLCVGTLEPRKNLPALLSAFEHMNKEGHMADLTFCTGAQWQAGPVLDFIQNYSGPGKIEVLHRVPDAELARQYAKADALVFASLYEGFGLPLVEAVGQTAVIANDIPVFRELSQHVDGLEFVDFSLPPAKSGQQLKEALERCVKLQLNSAVSPGTFTWVEFTRQIVRNLGISCRPSVRTTRNAA